MSKEKEGCFLDKQTYVDKACKVIKSLETKKITVGKGNEKEDKKIPILTTTQIRKLLSQLNEIYSFVVTMSNGDSTKTGVNTDENRVTDLAEKMQYFKMRCIYEAGRDNIVKDFIEKAKIVEYIESMCADKQYKSIREKFILFFRYMEALVAYHRFEGGKDK